MSVFIGVDPGLSGALACIDETGDVRCYPTPVHRARTSNGRQRGRSQYDLAGIREWFFERGALWDLFVTVEASRPMPPKMKGGTIANFNRGVSCGWEWMLVGLGVSYQLVRPVDWQRALHAGTPSGDTKQRSILAAQRLFPGVDLRRTPRCRKVDDGIAEALLLAEYGRRVYAGSAKTSR